MPDHDFVAIGTQWRIQTDIAIDADTVAKIATRIEEFDVAYSRFRADSDVSQFALTTGAWEFPADASALFCLYRRLYALTNGSVTPLVGRALEHLGYDADYSLRRRPGTIYVPAWDDALTIRGNVVTSNEPVLLDVGAAGKGYLVDIVAALLRTAGHRQYLIDASGDLAQLSSSPTRIGLESPTDPTQAIGIANLRDGAICASAANRRRWADNLHHIINPATAEPVSDVIATWVVADSAMVADGLATALFFADPAVLAREFSFSYVRMLATGRAEYSTNFDGELFR